jgi:hypothetical protein
VGRKLGRPRNPALEREFKPTVEHRALVKLLAGYLIPHDRIVQAIRNPLTRRPISIPTLLKHFEHELAAGRAEVDSLIAEGLTKKLREGHMTALIWCSKNLWNWADKVEQQTHSTVDMSVDVHRREDLQQALRAHGLESIAEKGLFGYDTAQRRTLMLEHEQFVSLVRSADQLPETSDGAEHQIVGASPPPEVTPPWSDLSVPAIGESGFQQQPQNMEHIPRRHRRDEWPRRHRVSVAQRSYRGRRPRRLPG